MSRPSRGDYDYLNARVRGMSTALLTAEFYDHVLSSYSDSLLMDALLASPYASDVRAVMAETGSTAACRIVEAAAARRAHAAFAKVLAIAPPEPRRILALVLNRWDTANVLALARGVVAGESPGETREALLPLGELSASQLAELAAERELVDLADALPSWRHGFAFVLRRAIRECASPRDPRALERDLYGAYFTWSLAQLGEADRQQAVVRRCIRTLVDLANVMLALSRVRDGAPREARGSDLIPRGTIAPKVLREVAEAGSMEEGFEALMQTWLAPGIERGILAYGQAQRLAVMERFLEQAALERGCRLFRQDMLGVGVPLGFIWRTYCECANLRLLARGAAYRMPPEPVRQELVIG
jgi:V/A-type H+/Na+-transporting ATPase subunit C